MTDPIYQPISMEDDPAGKSDGLPTEPGPSASAGASDLPPEQIDAARRKARINAMVLIAVFIFMSLAPYPWNIFAPLLFLIPLIVTVSNRVRRGRAFSDSLPDSSPVPTKDRTSSVEEPYSWAPKDPNDPRRYKPID